MTDTNEWTPGPWKCFVSHDTGVMRVNPVKGGLVVAECSTRNPFDAEQEANARLIAAAPDLAEALEAFASVRIERATANSEATNPHPDGHIIFGVDNWYLTVGMVRKARAALAKARGEA